MRVLVVHNAYQQTGGEDAVVRNEVAMLRERGHDIYVHIVSNERISGYAGSIRAAIGAIYSNVSYRQVLKLIADFQPDVVHVHNFFPLISPSVFYACHKGRVPNVFTLHNFRILCPTALLMHDGDVTERSLQEGPWWAVPHRVYRDSLLGTFVLAAMIFAHKFAGTWSRKVTRFIALSSFAASKFAEAGLPSASIVVKPNFVDIGPPRPSDRFGMLFVGRLSREKGIEVLASAVGLLKQVGSQVRVAGVGPLQKVLSDAPGMVALGNLDAAAVSREMASAQALVLPSLWYEGFPMVLVEAYANGLPVIASRLGALAELVDHGVTGLLFDPGSAYDLADKMQWALDHPEKMAAMGRAARKRYEARYTQEHNYAQLMAIYVDAIFTVTQERAKNCD